MVGADNEKDKVCGKQGQAIPGLSGPVRGGTGCRIKGAGVYLNRECYESVKTNAKILLFFGGVVNKKSFRNEIRIIAAVRRCRPNQEAEKQTAE